MKRVLSIFIIMACVFSAQATTNNPGPRVLFVSTNGSHTAPFATMLTAATNIQAAVDEAVDGDEIQLGDRQIFVLRDPLDVDKAVTIRTCAIFTHSPWHFATISGDNLTRCVEINHNDAILESLKITQGMASSGAGILCKAGTIRDCIIYSNNAVSPIANNGGGGVTLNNQSTMIDCEIYNNSSDQLGGGAMLLDQSKLINCELYANTSFSGGGVHAESDATVSSCNIHGNHAEEDGGGVSTEFGSTITACEITNNSAARDGGGLYCGGYALVENCTISKNRANGYAGGAFMVYSVLRNSLLTDNNANQSAGATYFVGGTLESSTLAANSADSYGGFAGIARAVVQNCIVTENTSVSSPTNWGEASGMTGDVTYINSCTTPLMPGPGNIDTPPVFRIAGGYRLATDSPCVNAGTNQSWMTTNAVDLQNSSRIVGGTTDMGAYETGIFRYVAKTGSHTPPFSSWASAATNMQDAIDLANSGETIIVDDGIYNIGSRVSPQTSTRSAIGFYSGNATPYISGRHNRVVINKPITVQSLNGAAHTIIDASSRMRCAFIGNGAKLSGFTLENGDTGGSGVTDLDSYGGGAFVDEAVLTDCIIRNNEAGYISRTDYMVGGGVYARNRSVIERCVFEHNKAFYGANINANLSTVQNCLITKGYAWSQGGGIYLTGPSLVEHCTITENKAACEGGGVFSRGGQLMNSIIHGNTASGDSYTTNSCDNWWYQTNTVFMNCCTLPLPPDGSNNITVSPEFVVKSYYLSDTSPCLDAGRTNDLKTDLAGHPRSQDGDRDGLNAPDLGAYENAINQYAYVSKTGSHTPPFHSWESAANDIQSAVDSVATDGWVFVSDGIYDTGSYPTPNGDPQYNRVVIDRPLTLRSVNGAEHTTIAGREGETGTRCVYMTNGVNLTGFTIKNGRVANTSPFSHHDSNKGGGVLMDHGGILRNCIVQECFADNLGGGIACQNGGLIENCTVTDNSGMHGGNIQSSGGNIRNCIVTSGSSYIGGGILISDGSVQHCTIYGNHSSGEGGGINCGNNVTVRNCIVFDNQCGGYSHNSRNIKSRETYTNCIEYTCSFPLATGEGNIDQRPLMRAPQIGNFRLRNDSPCRDAAKIIPDLYLDYTDSSRQLQDGHISLQQTNCDMGAYEYDPTETHIVDPALTGTNGPASIQQAVDRSDIGDEIIVADGDYSFERSETPGYDGLSRLLINKPVAIRSVNGAEYTSIQGSTNNTRCVYLSEGASLEGFTLFGGKVSRYGAGALLDQGGLLTQCIVRDNLALSGGGGACMMTGGIIEKSMFADNSAMHGGGIQCEQGLIQNCLIRDNVCYRGGGLAMQDGIIRFCTVVNNSASGPGGGIDVAGNSSIYSCIIVSNRANNFPGVTNDCSNWVRGGSNVHFSMTCTTPDPNDWQCFTNDPLFRNPIIGNYQLSMGSPCIDRTTACVGALDDIRGTSRHIDGNFDGFVHADIGAYEYNPVTTDSDHDNLSDADEIYIYSSDPAMSDSDNDGMSDGDEIIAGYSPTNATSALYITVGMTTERPSLTRSLSVAYPTIQWQSIPGKSYNVLRSTDLTQGFTIIGSNIAAAETCTSFIDNDLEGVDRYYYKIELAQ